MKPNKELIKFLNCYNKDVVQVALKLRSLITNTIPQTNELIWDNYNALAIAYSKSEQLKDAFCHIALYSKYVNFGFNRGAELSPNKIKLEGKGKLIRHIKVFNYESFPKEEVVKLIHEAVGISEAGKSSLSEKKTIGKSIVMSKSEKKIRPKN